MESYLVVQVHVSGEIMKPMGFFQDENKKTFKLLLLIVIIVSIVIVFTLTNWGAAVQTKTIIFEDEKYIFDKDVNFTEDVNIIGDIIASSTLKVIQGISTIDEDINPLFDIFVATAPNDVMDSSIPESTDNALVIQRSGPPNTNFIDVVFWDSDTNRPLLVLNAGDTGRASTFDRSLQVGKDFASDILNLNYTICQGTSLADCDTLGTGADLVVEDDIENFGSLQVHENGIFDGNLSFAGAFGELFESGSQTMISISDANVFFPIAGIQTGSFRNTLVNDTNITVQIEGTYLVNYSISFSNANNVNYTSGILLNGVIQSNGQSDRRLAANDTGNMAGTAIFSLNPGDNVSMGIANISNTSNVVVGSTNLTITYIGG